MKRILLVLLSFTLVGCATMPGTISERISSFDKSTEITMTPACVKINFYSCFELGLYKTSKMDTDKAILTAVVNGAENFADKGSLMLNIDGDIITLESIDLITNIQTIPGEYGGNESSKRYEVTKDLIKRMIEGKEVGVKINLSTTYVEGKFSDDNFTMARPAFRQFYKKAWESKTKGDS